ncbi:MAG: VUT family protein [Clostridiales bacterium]|nr:VUT family protein [Clostridiales bacterium]
MKEKIKKAFAEFQLLLKSVPPLILSLFILAVFAMNLLANKSIDTGVDWLALDCGIVVSWIAFLCMDVLTKRFGPKAATQISLLAMAINLLACLLFFAVSKIGGTWAQYFELGEQDVVNEALNNTIGGTWYVVLGSAVAFAVSAVVNNFSNFFVGRAFKKNPDGFGAYACRTYVSTAIAQFVDNLVFALLVSHFFFGWTVVQCLTCAATGMIVELLCEAVFSPLGFVFLKRSLRTDPHSADADSSPCTEEPLMSDNENKEN